MGKYIYIGLEIFTAVVGLYVVLGVCVWFWMIVEYLDTL